jgi:hypothetical protein
MNPTKDKLVTTLPYFLRVKVQLQELVVALDTLDVLTVLAKKIVKEEVKSLLKITEVLQLALHTAR